MFNQKSKEGEPMNDQEAYCSRFGMIAVENGLFG